MPGSRSVTPPQTHKGQTSVAGGGQGPRASLPRWEIVLSAPRKATQCPCRCKVMWLSMPSSLTAAALEKPKTSHAVTGRKEGSLLSSCVCFSIVPIQEQ